MTMNAYQAAQKFGLTGTPAEIVATLKSTGLTRKPILLDDLMAALNIPLKMLTRLPKQSGDGVKWSGTLFNLILFIQQNGTQEQIDAVNEFFSHITNDRNVTFDTTMIAFASQFWAIAQQFSGMEIPDGEGGVIRFPSAADFRAVADLGGGWLYADLTPEVYEAQRQSAIDEAAEAERIQSISSAIDQAVAAVQQHANETEVTAEDLIATFTTTLQQHWN